MQYTQDGKKIIKYSSSVQFCIIFYYNTLKKIFLKIKLLY